MSEIITCPAPLEMLRLYSPVVTPDGHRGCVVAVDHDYEGSCLVYIPLLGKVKNYHYSALEMDLTDPTGRAHAAWWVASQAKWWPTEPDFTTATWHARAAPSGPVWSLGYGHYWPSTHAAVCHLDPTDDTRLPDGSRVVGALALKASVGHLLTQREVA